MGKQAGKRLNTVVGVESCEKLNVMFYSVFESGNFEENEEVRQLKDHLLDPFYWISFVDYINVTFNLIYYICY